MRKEINGVREKSGEVRRRTNDKFTYAHRKRERDAERKRERFEEARVR